MGLETQNQQLNEFAKTLKTFTKTIENLHYEIIKLNTARDLDDAKRLKKFRESEKRRLQAEQKQAEITATKVAQMKRRAILELAYREATDES